MSWIKFSEQQPGIGDCVIVCDENCVRFSGGKWFEPRDHPWHYWMPFPELPLKSCDSSTASRDKSATT